MTLAEILERVDEIALAVTTLIGAALALYKRLKAARLEEALAIVAREVEPVLDKQTKTAIAVQAAAAGVSAEVHAAVEKGAHLDGIRRHVTSAGALVNDPASMALVVKHRGALAGERITDLAALIARAREMEKPMKGRSAVWPLALLAVLVLFVLAVLPGCCSSVVRDHARRALGRAELLRAASVPHPSYDDAAKAKWAEAWDAHLEHLRALSDVADGADPEEAPAPSPPKPQPQKHDGAIGWWDDVACLDCEAEGGYQPCACCPPECCKAGGRDCCCVHQPHCTCPPPDPTLVGGEDVALEAFVSTVACTDCGGNGWSWCGCLARWPRPHTETCQACEGRGWVRS